MHVITAFFFSFVFVSSRSLQRALDKRLYLLLYGTTYGAPDGKPVWHFPEKVYENEETLREVITFPIVSLCVLFPSFYNFWFSSICSVLSLL